MQHRDKQFLRKLTQGLYTVSLLTAILAAGLTADMIEGKEDVMFLMYVDWKLNLYLYIRKQSVII